MTSTPKASRILVWDLPLRLFHWLLAASFAGAFLTAESERWRDIHAMLGYTMLALVAFRIAWGFVGPRYARFATFTFGPSRIVSYLRSLANGAPHHYTGHNPAGSWAIFALLGCAIVAGGTGLALYNDIGGRWMEHLHEFAANAMLAVVAVHLVGVAAGSLLHRENLVRAMVTGRKSGAAGDAIGGPRRVVALLLVAAVVGLWTGVVPAPGLTTVAAMMPVKPGATAPAYTERRH
jgi:cytochrome b